MSSPSRPWASRRLALAALIAAGCGGQGSGKIRLSAGPEPGAGVATASSVLQVEAPGRTTVAIGLFDNRSGDDGLAWLRRGLADMLVAELSQIPSLNVLTPSRLEEVIAQAGATSAGLAEPAESARVARQGHIDRLVAGFFHRDGAELVIDAELSDLATGAVLSRASARGPGPERILLMVGELSRQVGERLRGVPGPPDGDIDLAEMTSSVEAFRHYSRGIQNQERFLVAEADADFTRAIASDPSFAAAYLRRAHIRMNLGEHEVARDLAARARELAERLSPVDRLRLGVVEASIDGDVQRLAELRDELGRHAPNDVDACLDVAMMLFEAKENDRALEELERLVEIDPTRKRAFNLLGYLYAYRGDFNTALRYLERYRQLTPDEPNAYDSMGEVLMMAGRLREAAGRFEEALARWPDFFNSARNLTRVNAELGDLEQALAWSERWIAAAPNAKVKAQAQLERGATLWRFGRTDEAELAFRTAAELAPTSAWPALYAGEMHDALGEGEIADRWRRDCIERHRSLPEGVDAAALLRLGLSGGLRPDEVLDLSEEACRREKRTAQRDLLGLYATVLNRRAGRPERAAACAGEGASRGVAGLIAARYVGRSWMWKYIVEAADSEPEGISTAGRLDAVVERAAERSGRKDLAVLARLLDVQSDVRHGQAERAAAGYRDLGVPPEQEWRVVGPFRNLGGFHGVFPPETERDLGAHYQGADGEVGWRQAADGVSDGFVDLGAVLGRSSWSVGYGVVLVESPGPRVVQIRLGADEACKLWVNQELVWQAYRREEAGVDNDIVQVMLRAGDNEILVKVTNSLSDWGFYLRVTDTSGDGFADLRFHAPGRDRAALGSGAEARPGG